MFGRKIASFLLALSVILVFPAKSIAQSEKEIFWWTDDEIREELKNSEKAFFSDYYYRSGTGFLGESAINEEMLAISSSTPEIIWKKLLTAFEQNKISRAYTIAKYIYNNNISFRNNISSSKGKSLSEDFYALGLQFSKNKCKNHEYKNALLAYLIALDLYPNPKHAESLFQLGDFCFESFANSALDIYSMDSGDDFIAFLLLYGYGLNLKPSSESYLSLASKLFLFTSTGYISSENQGFSISSIAVDYLNNIIADASKQSLEYPNKKITIYFSRKLSIVPEFWSTEITGKSHAFAYIYIGHTYKVLDDFESSFQAFNQAIKHEPNFAFPYNGLGQAHMLEYQTEDAINSFKKAIELKPDYADAYNSLGNIYTKKEQWNKALNAYKKAVYFNRKNQIYKQNLSFLEMQISYSRGIASGIDPKLDPSANHSVVRVMTDDLTELDCGSGTGWIVSNNNNQAWIITNRHVVEKCINEIQIVLYDDSSKSLPAKLFKMDEIEDFAVLIVPNMPTNIEPLPIASTPPAQGDTIFVIGHPEQGVGTYWTNVQGTISAIMLGLFQLDITVDGGNSGSPVLNKDNEVIGLVFEVTNDKSLGERSSAGRGRFAIAYPMYLIQEKLKLWGVPYETK